MFRKVGSLVKLSPRYSKSEGALSAIKVRQLARDAIGAMCRDYPEEVLKKIQVKSYQRGTLTIVCPGVVSSELYMRSGELIDDVNSRVGVKILRSIKFRAG